MEQSILAIHVASTWFMIGVIWLVQLGQYPLFASVGGQNFPDYYSRYSKAIGCVVTLPMCAELITGGFLLKLFATSDKAAFAMIGFMLILLIWSSTFFLQVPQHRILEHGFEPKAHRKLVMTNWVRTLLWSTRGLLVTLFLI